MVLADLEEAHTRKIHLLISDIAETDYHHEHPEPAGDGEYAFSFTPHRPDTYRVWADLMPARTHVQQYSVADIPSSTPRQARLAENETENRHAEIDGYRFDLSFDKGLIRERETVAGKLRVTDPDGRPCNKLGVVMGAFGHFVAFGDDFATVLHLHPTGPLITDPEARGGPELPFYFRSKKTGLFRLFAQVRIEGKDYFPRFVLHAGLRPRRWAIRNHFGSAKNIWRLGEPHGECGEADDRGCQPRARREALIDDRSILSVSAGAGSRAPALARAPGHPADIGQASDRPDAPPPPPGA